MSSSNLIPATTFPKFNELPDEIKLHIIYHAVPQEHTIAISFTTKVHRLTSANVEALMAVNTFFRAETKLILSRQNLTHKDRVELGIDMIGGTFQLHCLPSLTTLKVDMSQVPNWTWSSLHSIPLLNASVPTWRQATIKVEEPILRPPLDLRRAGRTSRDVCGPSADCKCLHCRCTSARWGQRFESCAV